MVYSHLKSFMNGIEFPIHVKSKLINPGVSNGNYAHSIAYTYFKGEQIIAFGSGRDVIVASDNLSIIAALKKHRKDSLVTAVAWAPHSGRLSSCATDLRILIWEPSEGSGWEFTQEIRVQSVPMCVSWSVCDYKFCVCADVFKVYQRESQSYRAVYTDPVKAAFCSYSRDSRFILTLQGDSSEVVLYHRRERSDDYCKVPLRHPSRVKSVRWRTSDRIHERACFMTVSDDLVARIWCETSVNEDLNFNIVAAVENATSAAFISTTSRLVAANPAMSTHIRTSRADTYAFGDGHYPVRDRDVRSAPLVKEREVNRNRFWILTIDQEQKIHVWEVKGFSASVRRTLDISHVISFRIKRGFGGLDLGQIYAFCRLDSEIGHFGDRDFIGKPTSLSLITQNTTTKVISTIDINLEIREKNRLTLNQINMLHGHSTNIRKIEVQESNSKMVTLGSSGQVFLWSFNDTDVYDPMVIVKFESVLPIKLDVVDWINANQLLGYDGKEIWLIEPVHGSSCYKQIPTMWEHEGEKLRSLRVVSELSAGFLCVAMFPNDIYFMWLREQEMYELLHVHSEEKYVDCTRAYITLMLPFAGATVSFWSTKRTVYLARLLSSEITQKPTKRIIAYEECVSFDEDIYGLSVVHPCWLFVACERHIYVCRRTAASHYSFEVFHSIDINYRPLKISSLPTGMLAVVGPEQIDLFHPVRKSQEYLKSELEWTLIASHKASDIGALEWTLDGMLLYSQGNELYTLTKFMDTFFLETNNHEKLPTFHQTVANCGRMVSDFHPSIMIPLTISGKFNLVMKMLKFLYEKYDDEVSRWFYTDALLQMPPESLDPRKLADDPANCEVLKQLAEKIETTPIPELKPRENEELLNLVRRFRDIAMIHVESLDQKGLIVARAVCLNSQKMLPFDLMSLALLSQDQANLVKYMDLSTWESIEASGIFFWYRDLSGLQNLLVTFAVDVFDRRSFLSILILTMTRRFRVLGQLFKKAGDDTRAAFFIRDFSIPKNRVFAEKNGYSALSKQDYHIAVAMFMLADRLDLSFRIAANNLRDLSLVYLIARCCDDGIGKMASTILDEHLIPRAREGGDLAAVAFFNHIKNPTDLLPMLDRYRQFLPNNMFKSSNYFGDQRFCVCTSLGSSLDEKTDLCLSLIVSGHYLLAAQFLPYFDTFVLNTSGEVEKSEVSRTVSMSFDVIDAEKHEVGNSMLIDQLSREVRSDDEMDDMDDVFGQPAEKAKELNFGFTLDDMQDSDNSLESSDMDSSSDEQVPAQRSAVRASQSITFGYNFQGMKTPKATGKSYKAVLNDESDYEYDEEAEYYTNWFTIVVVFNIARYRLESFIETQNDFSQMSKVMSQLRQEIEAGGGHICSMMPQLINYLIRSCKRRCFVFRRLLLSNSEFAGQYMLEICNHLTLLPDHVLMHKFSQQQMTQIAQSVRVLMQCVNQKVVTFDEGHLKFIIGTVATTLFIIAMVDHNVNLMTKVLSLDLEHMNSFEQELLNYLDIHVVPPGMAPYGNKHVRFEHNVVTFLPTEIAEKICVGGTKLEHLPLFGSALLDFMLIDKFLRQLNKMSLNYREIFKKLLGLMRKFHDASLQFFSYSTLNFTDYFKLKSRTFLQDITIEGEPEISTLMRALIDEDDRKQQIPAYCRNLLDIFVAGQKRNHGIAQNGELQKSWIMHNSKAGINTICMNTDGTKLLVAEAQENGLRSIDIDKVTVSEEDESFLPIDDIDVGEEVELETDNMDDEEAEEAMLPQAVELALVPRCIAFNVSERPTSSAFSQAIIGYANGTVWNERVGEFTTPVGVACSAVSCALNGSMFAAVHGDVVRLWSCYGNYRKEPFMELNTLSQQTFSVDFLTGTGLIVTQQHSSPLCAGNLVFWDTLMPSNKAMVAAVNLTGKYGKSECMKYIPKYNQIIVGTNKGNVCIVDTRQFQVVCNIKAHTARHVGVRSIAVDDRQTYFATGSSSGTLRIWDMSTSQIIAQRKNVHRPKSVKSRVHGITSIVIQNDDIYTSGMDGLVKCTKLRM